MINLLPPEIKDSRKLSSKVSGVIAAYVVIGAIIALLIAVATTYKFILDSQVMDRQSQLSSLETSAKAGNQLMSKAALVNDRLSSVAKYRDDIIWSDKLREIANSTPSDISLTEVKLDRASASSGIKIGVSGLATDRRSIVLFKDKLSANKAFSGVELTSVGEKSSDASSYTFTVTFALSQQTGSSK